MARIFDMRTRKEMPDYEAQVQALSDGGKAVLRSLVFTIQHAIAEAFDQRRITLDDMVRIADLLLREKRT